MTEQRTSKLRTGFTACVACLLIAGYASASPSGLNNIPTADVAPEKVLVFQSWGSFESGSSPSWTVGAKYGLLNGLEVGIDQAISSGDTGPLTLQAKYQLPSFGEKVVVQPLLGIANVSDDRDEAGEADPYAVFTFDAQAFRFHAGYSFQDDNDALFAGLDKTFKVMERDLMLRADIKQVKDGDETKSSLGLLYVLPYDLVFEGWGSFPSADGAEESLTLKLNYVIAF